MNAEEIKALRVKLGLTQQQLAIKLGCSVSAISKIETSPTRQLHPMFRARLARLAKKAAT